MCCEKDQLDDGPQSPLNMSIFGLFPILEIIVTHCICQMPLSDRTRSRIPEDW